MSYSLLMTTRENGEIRDIKHTRETERECDEAQLAELPRLESIGGELLSANVVRERARY